MHVLIEVSNIHMKTSNTKNSILYFLLIFGLLASYTSIYAQNDSIKKNSPTKKFSTFLDTQKKADGITIAIPEKTNLENLHPDTEVISIFVSSRITREMIEKLPKLKLIACRSTGFNNIDMQAAAEKDITIVNVPTYGESTVAEYAFTLLLALGRKLENVINAESSQTEQESLTGHDISGKVLGVVGAGHIGQHAIKIGNGFDMKVLAYDAMPHKEIEKELNFTYTPLDDLLKEADVVTIHAPYLPATHHLINEQRLKMIVIL